MKGRFIDLTGLVFGRLRVVEKTTEKRGQEIVWLCHCAPDLGGCGNYHKACGVHLRDKQTQSCGCLSKDTKKQQGSHNLSRSSLYKRWRSMRDRCNNPNNKFYKNYGGRGITICEAWKTFEGFYRDMGASFCEDLSLDRIDNDANYCPENCRWTTKKEQNRNTTLVRPLTFKGETKLVSDWAREYNLNISCLLDRLRRGWTVEKAITTPPRVKNYG